MRRWLVLAVLACFAFGCASVDNQDRQERAESKAAASHDLPNTE
jgi:hypothetical protein